MKILLILTLLSSFALAKKDKDKAAEVRKEWGAIKEALTPKKKKGKHAIKETNDKFQNIREKTVRDYEREKRNIIKENRKLFDEKMQKTAKSKLAKDKAENEQFLKQLEEGSKTNIKFWLKATRYLKTVNGHLKDL